LTKYETYSILSIEKEGLFMEFPDDILKELMSEDPFVSDLESSVWSFDGERATLNGDFSADELTKIAQYMAVANIVSEKRDREEEGGD
jgi:hypothetical protein